MRTGRSLRCDDSETDDRVDREGCKALGIRSMVAVPIRPGNKVAGLLEVFSPQPYAFNANDISALQQLTGSILPALTPESRRSSPTLRARSPDAKTRPVTRRRIEASRRRVDRAPACRRGSHAFSATRPVHAVKPSAQRPAGTRFCSWPRSPLLFLRCCG